MYGLKSDEYIAKELHRPPASVRKMAETIFTDPVRTGEWKEAEIKKLKKYLGICEVDIIARIFGRAPADVAAQIEKFDDVQTDGDWAQEELADLKRLYGTRTDRNIARIFGRSEASVTAKATELCLAKDKAFVRKLSGEEATTRMPRWTAEEIEKLKGMYANFSNLEIAQALNRSVKSVVSKAHIIGLKKDPKRLQDMGRQNVSLRYGRQAELQEGEASKQATDETQAKGASLQANAPADKGSIDHGQATQQDDKLKNEGAQGGALSSSESSATEADETGSPRDENGDETGKEGDA